MKKDLRKLKVIPFYFFVRKLHWANKILFFVLFAALLSMAAGILISAEDPGRFVTNITTLQNAETENVLVKEFTENYRSMDFSMPAVQEEVFFVAGPMTQPPWLSYALILAIVLSFSIILTAGTYFKNWGAYVVAGVFLAFFTTSGVSMFIMGTDEPSRWIDGGLAIMILFPGVLFHQRILKFRLVLRFLTFLILLGLPFLLTYQTAGFVGLHGVTTNLYPIMMVIALVFVFFVAKEPTNFIFYATSNLKNKKFRLKFPFVLALFIILFAIEFLMLHNALRWNFIPVNEIGIKPLHLLVAAAVLTVFTSQNLYPKWKSFISNAGMSLGILGFALLGTSIIFFHIASGEFLFRFQVERAVSILFPVLGLFHFLYITLNFLDLINNRINYYFLTMTPRRIMYVFVIIGTILFSITLEASDSATARKLFYSSMYNRLGDQLMLENRNLEALNLYRSATSAARGTVKGNYNYAYLTLSELKNSLEALDYYHEAYDNIPYGPAALNRANLQIAEYMSDQAMVTLQESERKQPNAYVGNNLALLFKQANKPDSTIKYLKSALRLEPEMSSLYANMASLYMDYEKPEWAEKFLDAGLKAKNISPGIVANSLLFNLKQSGGPEVDPALLENVAVAQDPVVRLNYSLHLYRSGKLNEAKVYLDSLLEKNETAEALLLHGMVLLETGEVDLGLSRFEYLTKSAAYQNYRAQAHHFLGMAFFQQKVPEMAAYHFSKSVEVGDSADLFNWGVMLLDAEMPDSGYNILRLARSKNPELLWTVGREESLLNRAYGDEFAFLTGMLDNLKPDEYVRMARYAGIAGNFAMALDNFQSLIALDSNNATPYLEMGRIYLNHSNYDTAAVENLKYGAQLFPDNQEIQLELTRAYLRMHKLTEAEQHLARATELNPEAFDVSYYRALLAVEKGDSAGAAVQLDALHKARPLDTRVILSLAKIYKGMDEAFKGQELLYNATQRNWLNAGLWIEMAYFERMAGREKEVGVAALKAIELTPDEQEKIRLGGEFAAELRSLAQNDLE